MRNNVGWESSGVVENAEGVEDGGGNLHLDPRLSGADGDRPYLPGEQRRRPTGAGRRPPDACSGQRAVFRRDRDVAGDPVESAPVRGCAAGRRRAGQPPGRPTTARARRRRPTRASAGGQLDDTRASQGRRSQTSPSGPGRMRRSVAIRCRRSTAGTPAGDHASQSTTPVRPPSAARRFPDHRSPCRSRPAGDRGAGREPPPDGACAAQGGARPRRRRVRRGVTGRDLAGAPR